MQGADRARASLLPPLRAHRHLAQRAEALLAEWELADQRDVPTRELAYGKQRQVELLLALAGRPRVLLLDEPTAGLSAAETARVVAMVQRFTRDVSVLLIEHDMDVALALADRITVLHQGRVLADGGRDEVRADPRVSEIYLGPADA
jgi:branched-chain amino acid transport system ATP-binding protein